MYGTKRLSRITTFLLIFAGCCGVSAQSQEKQDVWTLGDCIDYAVANNISIEKNRISAESSYVDILTAKAALFPNLSFSTSHNYVNRPLIDDGSTKTNSYNGNYGLNASWTVYNGGRNTKNIRQQKLNNRIAELNTDVSKDDIVVSIMQVYIQILYANESVKINENNLETSEAQVNRARELLAAGSIARSDYAQLESQCSSDRYNLVNSQTVLQDYKLQLKQLLELDGEEEIEIAYPEVSEESVLAVLPDKSDAYRAALAIRPGIEAARLNMEAGELSVGIARAGYFPTISLSAGTGTNHTSGSDFTFGEQVKNGWNNSLGVTLSIPIFSNRENKSAIQKAKLNYQTSKLNLIDEEKTLYRTIETCWQDATSARQKYLAARENLGSSEISYELVSEQFSLGMKNTVELLTEKNSFLSAQQETIQSKYMAILSMQLLSFYQGEEIQL